ncbi:Solute carrier family 2, facilitated glucose transporter member 8 [Eumeta japonica]|uniref:Solute carrier family 2, facilitated glucose transporter member 8 n=1 Tax=Eumeta variegata TaxID=151549 RepID=A0A4C1UGB9_EUMVA|nr:Solute carrier family 2, facilitated glucose transporter member 8 [Eumeta japonica]
MVEKIRLLWKEGSQLNQIICAVIINLPLLAYGASIGWMSPMTPVLQSSQSPRGTPLTDEEISWMASTTYVTGVPTVFLFGYMVDKIGRKYSLLICTAQFAAHPQEIADSHIHQGARSVKTTNTTSLGRPLSCNGCMRGSVACWTVKLLSSQVWALVIARGLVGTGMAGCFVVTPLYIKEISDDSIRGALGTLIILSQTVGNVLLYVVGDLLSYHATLWFCLSLPIVHLCLSFILPETPSYLIRQGKTEQTVRTLAWLRCRRESDPAIAREMDLMKKELEQDEENQQFALKSILKDKILFRAFKITMVLCLAREVCGTIPVLNFASDIFRMASDGGSALPLTPNQQAIMLGLVQVTGSALASSVVEKAGRKVYIEQRQLFNPFNISLRSCPHYEIKFARK